MAKQLRKCHECVDTYHRCVKSWPDVYGDESTPEGIAQGTAPLLEVALTLVSVLAMLRRQDIERLKEALVPQKGLKKLPVVFYEILKYPAVLNDDLELNNALAKVSFA